MSDAFFRIFADVARSEGRDAAIAAYRGNISDAKIAEMVSEYDRLVQTVEHGEPGIIAGTGIESWYTGPLEQDPNWGALKKFFDNQLGWTPELVDPVDRASTKVVGCTPQPKEPKWTSKGLVVGYVQSGKTTNFTAVIAKAADLKYRLVVVLSGIHNSLRRQTQKRLATQLGLYNPNAWIELTSLEDDFREPTMTMASLLYERKSGTALAVVKKNKARLTFLKTWIKNAADQNALGDLPVLIIDDESDQASVATKTINPLIMDIIKLIPRCTYIGYTATPFANVLIDPSADDLYPSSFILNLPEPQASSGYFGSEKIFGRDAVEGDEASGTELDGYDVVRIIDDKELPSLRPLKRKDIADFEPVMTSSLVQAVNWFWLATSARRARADKGHSSMLIHTHLSTVVHDRFKAPLIELRDSTLRKIDEKDETFLGGLQKLWDEEIVSVPKADFPDLVDVGFDQIISTLKDVVSGTKVVVDNSTSSDRLDYSEDSQIVIAVGGNTLSRGLTLEGLVVSYFVRSSTAYDTLLQMARWFGYRPGYEDLPRIWMTKTLKEWFRHLATVEREIRLDIARYEEQGFTPTQVAVRIRTHPQLAVTAKMGAFKPVAASFSDQRVQTRYFREGDADWLGANLRAADRLVRDIRADGHHAEFDSLRGAALFRAVAVDRILEFLDAYRVHQDSPDLSPVLLSAYIKRELEDDRLVTWTVAVMAERAGHEDESTMLGGIDFKRVRRAALKDSPSERADIKTLMSKEHRVVDLDIEPMTARSLGENELVIQRNVDSVYSTKGLLLLYPIDPKSVPDAANAGNRRPLNADGEVIGLGLVFPESSGTKDSFVSVDLSRLDLDLSPESDGLNTDDELGQDELALIEGDFDANA